MVVLDQFFNAKVADFGISVDVSQTNGYDHRTRGTPFYIAPEVAHLGLNETYDAYKADIYSLGVLLYVMLYGEFPLREDSDAITSYDSNSIKRRDSIKMPKENKIQGDLGCFNLRSLLTSMLSIDPDKRPCILEILEWDWLKFDWNDNLIQDILEEMEQRKNFISDHHLSAF